MPEKEPPPWSWDKLMLNSKWQLASIRVKTVVLLLRRLSYYKLKVLLMPSQTIPETSKSTKKNSIKKLMHSKSCSKHLHQLRKLPSQQSKQQIMRPFWSRRPTLMPRMTKRRNKLHTISYTTSARLSPSTRTKVSLMSSELSWIDMEFKLTFESPSLTRTLTSWVDYHQMELSTEDGIADTSKSKLARAETSRKWLPSKGNNAEQRSTQSASRTPTPHTGF